MSINLTENAIPAIINGDVDAKPLVQILGITLLVSSDDSLLRKYYRKLSDGVSSHPATIAAQLNDGVRTGRVKEGSIVQLLDYVCPTILTQKIIIVHNMETIVLDSQIIGNPKSFVDSELPTVENEETSVVPIAALHPYKGRWAIKARVTAKGHLRHYNIREGYAKAFSFHVLDSDGGEIRVTCLNDVIDSFYEAIEVGKVYLISKGGLKPTASKDLKHLKIDWEIMLNSNSTVELCDEDDSIPMHKFSFRSISNIENVESNTILDVIGVVSVNSSVLMSRENTSEMRKRILNLKDNSGRSVELTLWGELCNREGQELKDIVDAGGFPVLAVKAGKVNEFRGKSINATSTTRLFVNPDFPAAQSLRLWFDQDGKDSASSSISKDIAYGGPKNELRKTVSQIKDEGLGRTDKPDWITTRTTISFMKTDVFCYTACPVMIGDRRCNKKVTKSVNTRWKCDRCNQEFDVCQYRYILQAQIVDHTGLTCVTAFNEAGEDIMGYSAKDLYAFKYEQEDDERFRDIIKEYTLQSVCV